MKAPGAASGNLQMKKMIAMAFVAMLAATSAQAAGVDLSGQSTGFIFKGGERATFGFGALAPSVSGTAVPVLGGAPSGNMTEDLVQYSLSYKRDTGGAFSYGIIYDQPFGASVAYPQATGYFAAGSTAKLESDALTAVARYTSSSNVSLLAGLRSQTLKASADIFYVAGYQGDLEDDNGLGYLLGVAYERPEIALRVALTYNSAIEHALPSAEQAPLYPPMPALMSDETEITTPQSVNLEFQSGIAADTLVFGSVRWVDWSAFEIAPPLFLAIAGEPLVYYEEDGFTYSLGLGRQLNDRFAGAVTLGYEASTDLVASHLGPTDGRTSLGLGLTYTNGPIEVAAGVQYLWLGDAETRLPIAPVAASFEDNTATAVGLSIGYRF